MKQIESENQIESVHRQVCEKYDESSNECDVLFGSLSI